MSDDNIKRHEFLEEKLHGQASRFQSLIFQLLQTRYLVYIPTQKLPSYKADCLKKIVTGTPSRAGLEAYKNYNP